MQPTPLTWQSDSPWPDSPQRRPTSFSSAVFTASLWQETQPAATHTLTVCLNLAWRSRSASAICSSSSGDMRLPIGQALAQRLRSDLTGNLVVVNDGRGQAARSQTASAQHGNLAVGRGLAGSNAEFLLHRLQQLRRTFDVAGGSDAEDASVLARRLEREKVIEGGNAIGPAQRHAQGPRHKAQGAHIEIAEHFLHGVERFDQAARVVAHTAHGGFNQIGRASCRERV